MLFIFCICPVLGDYWNITWTDPYELYQSFYYPSLWNNLSVNSFSFPHSFYINSLSPTGANISHQIYFAGWGRANSTQTPTSILGLDNDRLFFKLGINTTLNDQFYPIVYFPYILRFDNSTVFKWTDQIVYDNSWAPVANTGGYTVDFIFLDSNLNCNWGMASGSATFGQWGVINNTLCKGTLKYKCDIGNAIQDQTNITQQTHNGTIGNLCKTQNNNFNYSSHLPEVNQNYGVLITVYPNSYRTATTHVNWTIDNITMLNYYNTYMENGSINQSGILNTTQPVTPVTGFNLTGNETRNNLPTASIAVNVTNCYVSMPGSSPGVYSSPPTINLSYLITPSDPENDPVYFGFQGSSTTYFMTTQYDSAQIGEGINWNVLSNGRMQFYNGTTVASSQPWINEWLLGLLVFNPWVTIMGYGSYITPLVQKMNWWFAVDQGSQFSYIMDHQMMYNSTFETVLTFPVSPYSIDLYPIGDTGPLMNLSFNKYDDTHLEIFAQGSLVFNGSYNISQADSNGNMHSLVLDFYMFPSLDQVMYSVTNYTNSGYSTILANGTVSVPFSAFDSMYFNSVATSSWAHKYGLFKSFLVQQQQTFSTVNYTLVGSGVGTVTFPFGVDSITFFITDASHMAVNSSNQYSYSLTMPNCAYQETDGGDTGSGNYGLGSNLSFDPRTLMKDLIGDDWKTYNDAMGAGTASAVLWWIFIILIVVFMVGHYQATHTLDLSAPLAGASVIGIILAILTKMVPQLIVFFLCLAFSVAGPLSQAFSKNQGGTH